MSDHLHKKSSFPRWIWYALVILAIAGLPILVGGSAYWKSILISISLNVMLAMSLNLILGYTGQLHLGHSGFFGVGAYATTLLIQKAGLNFWVAMVASSMLAGCIGILLAFFATRLKGHYLAIASMAFAVILHQILLNWDSMTAGPLGLYGIAPPPPITIFGDVIKFSNQVNLFYLVSAIAVLVFIFLDNILRSPIGETLRAVREDEVSAASLGINTKLWKIFSFGVGASIAGLAGSFYPSFVGTLVPDSFSVVESFTYLAMVIVGGMGTMIGPVIGAIVLTLLPEVLRSIGDARLLVYGVTLTLVILFMPGGIVQGLKALQPKKSSTPV
ncbi:MAG: branched-chain amino acid ABC transporter permease [Betaproteobacteria bacterium]|jgi:branched-chain amino acid transport system permease protein